MCADVQVVLHRPALDIDAHCGQRRRTNPRGTTLQCRTAALLLNRNLVVLDNYDPTSSVKQESSRSAHGIWLDL